MSIRTWVVPTYHCCTRLHSTRTDLEPTVFWRAQSAFRRRSSTSRAEKTLSHGVSNRSTNERRRHHTGRTGRSHRTRNRRAMSGQWDPAGIFEVLASKESRRILAAASVKPVSAKELETVCESSLPTVYRRVNVLVDYDLLSEERVIDPDRGRSKQYSTDLREIAIEIDDGDQIRPTSAIRSDRRRRSGPDRHPTVRTLRRLHVPADRRHVIATVGTPRPGAGVLGARPNRGPIASLAHTCLLLTVMKIAFPFMPLSDTYVSGGPDHSWPETRTGS